MLRKLLMIVFGILLVLAAGSCNLYPLYMHQMMEKFNLTLKEANLFGSFINLGLWVAFTMGLIYDKFGPKISCIIGAVLLSGSYAVLHMIMNSEIKSIGLFPLLILAIAMGQGSALCYTTAVTTNLKHFSSNNSSIVGLLISNMAISPSIFTTYRQALSQIRIANYFLMISVFLGIIILLCGWVFTNLKHIYSDHEKLKDYEKYKEKKIIRLFVILNILILVIYTFGVIFNNLISAEGNKFPNAIIYPCLQMLNFLFIIFEKIGLWEKLFFREFIDRQIRKKLRLDSSFIMTNYLNGNGLQLGDGVGISRQVANVEINNRNNISQNNFERISKNDAGQDIVEITCKIIENNNNPKLTQILEYTSPGKDKESQFSTLKSPLSYGSDSSTPCIPIKEKQDISIKTEESSSCNISRARISMNKPIRKNSFDSGIKVKCSGNYSNISLEQIHTSEQKSTNKIDKIYGNISLRDDMGRLKIRSLFDITKNDSNQEYNNFNSGVREFPKNENKFEKENFNNKIENDGEDQGISEDIISPNKINSDLENYEQNQQHHDFSNSVNENNFSKINDLIIGNQETPQVREVKLEARGGSLEPHEDSLVLDPTKNQSNQNQENLNLLSLHNQTEFSKFLFLISTKEVYLLFTILILGIGSVISNLNNVQFIITSISLVPTSKEIFDYAIMYFVFNSFFRIISGLIIDKLISKNMLFHFLISISILGFISQTLGIFMDKDLLYLSVGLAGATHGGYMTFTPIYSKQFGLENMGKVLGFLTTGCAIGSLIGNVIFTVFFDIHKVGEKCVGKKCFSNAYVITSVFFAVNSGLSVYLYKINKDKNFYKDKEGESEKSKITENQ